MNKISQFENMAERLVEGTFARLFATRLSPLKVAVHLERAIEEHQVCIPGGVAQAPTHYWIYLNPKDYDTLTKTGAPGREGAEAERALAHQVTELISQADLALEAPPVVHVEPDQDVSPRDVRVEARWIRPESEEVERTRQMARQTAHELTTADQPGNEDTAPQGLTGRPFLVVEGNRHVNLTQPTVSVGRALDNDVIIDDPRVSRHHAQLQRRYGHYVLHDLDSTGGSKINGYPVEECLLHSGDVISFAGVEVIYGEDPPTPIPLPPDEATPAMTDVESQG
jgi:pSer/pThr/pTyr-binding forkhead associated (FHA) protein